MPRGLESCRNCALLFSALVDGRCERCREALRITPTFKECRDCRQIFDIDQFYKTAKGGRMVRCKDCFNVADRAAKKARAERARSMQARRDFREPGDLPPEPEPEPELVEEPAIDKEEIEGEMMTLHIRTRAERLRLAMAVAATKNTKRGRPRQRELDADSYTCSSCLQTMPAEHFSIDIKRAFVHPHCHSCISVRGRNRRSKHAFLYDLGRLVLWRMAYDATFPKNFLETR